MPCVVTKKKKKKKKKLQGGRAKGVSGAGPKEGTTRPLPMAKTQGEKSPDFSLPPASNSHHSFPLAKSNRKPVSKGTWEM